MVSASTILKISLGVACVAGFVLVHLFLRRLRARHASTWEGLGAPTLVLNNTISNSLRTWRFIWEGEYRVLDDSVLNRLGTILRLYWIAYIILFIVVVISVRSSS
ncbi:MAG: TRAP-type transport system small permease protein [Verrucomicrobiota bacterium]|jgi:hypothetical protein